MPFMELFKSDSCRKAWQMRFTDHTGCRRRLSTRQRSRTDALAISRQIEQLVGFRIRGDALPMDLLQWIAATHKDIRTALVTWDILDLRATQCGRRLEAHVETWEDSLLKSEVTPQYAAASARYVRQLCAACVPPLEFPADITAAAIDTALKLLRKRGAEPLPAAPSPTSGRGKVRPRKPWSPQTCNDCLARFQRFAKYLLAHRAIMADPTAGIAAYSREVVSSNRAYIRRALTLAEQTTLISVTAKQPDRWCMSGLERARLYRLVLATGLRADEVSELLVHWFDLKAQSLTIPSAVAKARREDVLPLRDSLIPMLTEQFKNKLPAASAWPPISQGNYSKMIAEDYAAAKIPLVDPSGKRVDFYTLRHTYGTELARVCLPAVHMQLMRHKDIKTTMQYYVHLTLLDNAAGVEKLPPIPDPIAPQQQKEIA